MKGSRGTAPSSRLAALTAVGVAALVILVGPVGRASHGGVWVPAASMMNERQLHASVLLQNGKVLVAGGYNEGPSGSFPPVATAEIYDPSTDTWSATGSMSIPRGVLKASLLADGRVLVTGGNDGCCTSRHSAELYDPGTGTWSSAGTMTVPRSSHTATVLPDGRVLVAGGNTVANCGTSSVDIFDPSTETWSSAAPLGVARSAHVAVLLSNGKVLVAGGQPEPCGSTGLTSSELYDPLTNTWTPTGSLITPRAGFTGDEATLLQSGKVLLEGGITPLCCSGALASAEVYDPATGLWSPTGSMSDARVIHTSTLMPDGTVLVVGGARPNHFNAWASAEIYNPLTGTWSRAASLLEPLQRHATTLLPGGAVLVSGGSCCGYDVSRAELYTSSCYDVPGGDPSGEHGIVSRPIHKRVEPRTGPARPTVHQINCTVIAPLGL